MQLGPEPSEIEKEVVRFKATFRKIVAIFFRLKDKYEHDDEKVYNLLKLFRTYLLNFSKKYPAIEITIDQEDLTSDDLKVFLTKYESKETILKKFRLKSMPVTMKENKKHKKLQVLLEYDALSNTINDSFDFFAILAIEGSSKTDKVEMPKELQLICGSIGEEFSTAALGGVANIGI